jgi:16S rRNA (cytosine967-C5)-methyltransferase
MGLSAPNPRRDAFRILRRVEDRGAYASHLLEARGAELTDPRDAALLTEIVLGVLRRRAPLDHALGRVASRPLGTIDGAVLTALRVGAYALLYLDRTPDFAAVDTAVALVKEAGWSRAAGFVNGILRTIARDRAELLPRPPAPGDVDALALYRSHPAWWVRRLVSRLGWERSDALLAANNEPAPTVLAVWPTSGTPAELAASLAVEGVVVAPCRFVPEALRVVSGVPQRSARFRDGAFWIQDEASQLATRVLGPAVGPVTLDACSAPGGKTLALAARTIPGGLVVAADRSAARLARLTQNLSRLNVSDVAVVACDTSRVDAFKGPFDDVLVDAPCSGTGTLRRHPEIRWRLRVSDPIAHADRQRRILRAMAPLVRPGGRLAYSVCSIEPEEGEAVVDAFLGDHPEFVRADPRYGLGPAAQALVGADLALRTSPLDDGMDGFFAALLTRRHR